jgi:hypothetical protein
MILSLAEPALQSRPKTPLSQRKRRVRSCCFGELGGWRRLCRSSVPNDTAGALSFAESAVSFLRWKQRAGFDWLCFRCFLRFAEAPRRPAAARAIARHRRDRKESSQHSAHGIADIARNRRHRTSSGTNVLQVAEIRADVFRILFLTFCPELRYVDTAFLCLHA